MVNTRSFVIKFNKIDVKATPIIVPFILPMPVILVIYELSLVMLITPIAIQTPLWTSPKLAMIIAILTPIARRSECWIVGLFIVISLNISFILLCFLYSKAILSSPPELL